MVSGYNMESTIKKIKGLIRPICGNPVLCELGENRWGQVRAQSIKEKLHQMLGESDEENFSEGHWEGAEDEQETQLRWPKGWTS